VEKQIFITVPLNMGVTLFNRTISTQCVNLFV